VSQPAIGDAIGIDIKPGIQIAAIDAEREGGVLRDHAAGLPSTERAVNQALRILEERQIVDVVRHYVVRDVEAVAAAIRPSVIRILIGGIHVSRRIVAAVTFSERFAVGVCNSESEPVAVTLLELSLQAVVIGVREAVEITYISDQTDLVALAL